MSSAIKYSFVGLLITAVVAIILWQPESSPAPRIDDLPEVGSEEQPAINESLRLAATSSERAIDPASMQVEAIENDGATRPLQLVARGADPRSEARSQPLATPPAVDSPPLVEAPVESRSIETPSTTASSSAPRTTEERVHVVTSGETLYGIAQKYLGRGMAWRELAEANPSLKPGRLLVGQKVVIPGGNAPSVEVSRTSTESEQPEVVAIEKAQVSRYHVVVEGDSLYTIAAQYYGSGHQWRRIQEANASSLEDWQIRPGMKLVVP